MQAGTSRALVILAVTGLVASVQIIEFRAIPYVIKVIFAGEDAKVREMRPVIDVGIDNFPTNSEIGTEVGKFFAPCLIRGITLPGIENGFSQYQLTLRNYVRGVSKELGNDLATRCIGRCVLRPPINESLDVFRERLSAISEYKMQLWPIRLHGNNVRIGQSNPCSLIKMKVINSSLEGVLCHSHAGARSLGRNFGGLSSYFHFAQLPLRYVGIVSGSSEGERGRDESKPGSPTYRILCPILAIITGRVPESALPIG
jgi:hypothetical protein